MSRRKPLHPSDLAAIEAGCYFDPRPAEHACQFLEQYCRLSQDRWSGQKLVLMDWQKYDVLYPLFGWRRPNGTRRFRRVGIWIAKKNAKTTFSAALALLGLMTFGDSGIEIYSAAVDRDQASIPYYAAASMVETSPELSARLGITKSTKTITRNTTSWYRALSKESKGRHGINPSMLFVDEIHVVDRDLFETLRHGGAARSEPLTITMSTAGYDQDGVGYEEYEYAKGVDSWTIEDWSFLPVIYEADKALPIDSQEAWAQANPSLGTIISEDEMAEAAKEAKASPRKEWAFRRLRLNQWTAAATAWISLDKWDLGARPDFDLDTLNGELCFGGLDLSMTSDTTAFVLAFPRSDGRVFLLRKIFLPEEAAIDAEKRDTVSWRTWAKQGHVTLIPGPVVLYDFVMDAIREAHARYRLHHVAYDPIFAKHIADTLQGEGIDMVEHRQGFYSMAAPCKEFERLIISEKLEHQDCPIMRWMASNVCVKTDPAGCIKPDKETSKKKIDGIVAAIMAVGRAMHYIDGGGPSITFLDD